MSLKSGAATETAMKRACKLAGGQSALARALGVKPQSVQAMVARNKPSHKRVIQIESLTGVNRHELRPDLYPANSNSGENCAKPELAEVSN